MAGPDERAAQTICVLGPIALVVATVALTLGLFLVDFLPIGKPYEERIAE